MKDKSINAAELNVARAFLKDNRIEIDPKNPSDEMSDLAEAMRELELEDPNSLN